MKIFLLFLLLWPGLLIAEEGPLKIGSIQSLTGIAAEFGNTALNGIRLAVAEINKDSQKIELLVEDDRSDAKNTVLAYKKLKNSGVEAILGPTWSFLTNSILPLAAKDQQIIFNTSTFPEALDLYLSGGYGFANAVSAKASAEPLNVFIKTTNFKNAAILHISNSYGLVWSNNSKTILAKNNIPVLFNSESVSYDENSWREIIPKIKSLNPELLLLLLNQNDIDILVRRLREINFPGKIFLSTNGYDAFLASPQKNLYNDICLSYPLKQLQSDSAFYKNYRSTYQQEPKFSADSSYDAVYLIYQAFRQSNQNRSSLLEALKNAEYQGSLGYYKYSEELSFSSASSSLVCINNSKAKIY